MSPFSRTSAANLFSPKGGNATNLFYYKGIITDNEDAGELQKLEALVKIKAANEDKNFVNAFASLLRDFARIRSTFL